MKCQDLRQKSTDVWAKSLRLYVESSGDKPGEDASALEVHELPDELASPECNLRYILPKPGYYYGI